MLNWIPLCRRGWSRLIGWKPDPLGPDWVNKLLNWIPDPPPWLGDLLSPEKWFGGSDPKSGGAAGKGEGLEMMFGPGGGATKGMASLRPDLSIDWAAAGTEIGGTFATAVTPVGTDIGQKAAAVIATHAALTKGPDPILSQQKNLMDQEFAACPP